MLWNCGLNVGGGALALGEVRLEEVHVQEAGLDAVAALAEMVRLVREIL
jgi:hypothetical protein